MNGPHRDDFRESVRWVGAGSIVIFTGTLGTGGIFALKGTMMRGPGTGLVFWLTVAAFAISALVALAFRARPQLWSMRGTRERLAVLMLVPFIIGLMGLTILCW